MSELRSLSIIRQVDETKLPAITPLFREKQNLCIKKTGISPLILTSDPKLSDRQDNKQISLKLTVQLPFLTGWELASVFDSREKKIIFAEASIEAEWGSLFLEETNTANCYFCAKKHGQYYVLLKSPDGYCNISQSCLDEAFGIELESPIISFITLFGFFLNEDKWNEVVSGAKDKKVTKKLISTLEYVAIAIKETKKRGFVRSELANSTKQAILEFIEVENNKSESIGLDGNLLSEAENIIKFYKDINTKSNYALGVKNCLANDFIQLDNEYATGILASSPSSYYKLVNKNEVLNAPFAEVKQRGLLKLRVNGIEPLNDLENPVIKYRFTDDEGRKFVWRASWPGKDELKVGSFFYMIATIKSHTEFNGVHYTMINRCSDIEEASSDSPSPDFYGEANKRTFKEDFSSSLEYKKDDTFFTEAHLFIKRRWREKGKIKDFEHYHPLSQLSTLKGEINSKLKLVSISKKDDLSKDRRHQSFFEKVVSEQEKINLNDIPSSGNVYCVEGALLSIMPKRKELLNETSKRIHDNLSEPRLFKSISAAESHGKRLKIGRLVTYRIKTKPNYTILPSKLMLTSVDDLKKSVRLAKDSGADFVVFIDNHGNVKYIRPLNLLRICDLKSIKPVHEPMSLSEKKAESRFLQGVEFFLVRDNFEDLRVTKEINNKLSEIEVSGLSKDIEVAIDKDEINTSLDYLLQEKYNQPHKKRVILSCVGEDTLYYLKLYGASVTNLVICKEKPEPGSLFIKIKKGASFSSIIGDIKNRLLSIYPK